MEPTLGNYNMKPFQTTGELLWKALHGPAPTEEQKQKGVIREPELGESGYSGMDYDAWAQVFNLPRKGDTFWQGLAKVMMAGGIIGGMGKGGINPEEPIKPAKIDMNKANAAFNNMKLENANEALESTLKGQPSIESFMGKLSEKPFEQIKQKYHFLKDVLSDDPHSMAKLEYAIQQLPEEQQALIRQLPKKSGPGAMSINEQFPTDPKDLERNVDIGRQAQVEAQHAGNKLERNPDMNWENPEAAESLVLGHKLGTEAVRTGEPIDPRILEGSLDQLEARINESTKNALVNPRIQIDKFNLNAGKGVRPQDFSKHLREADAVSNSLAPVANYVKELIERLKENQ